MRWKPNEDRRQAQSVRQIRRAKTRVGVQNQRVGCIGQCREELVQAPMARNLGFGRGFWRDVRRGVHKVLLVDGL